LSEGIIVEPHQHLSSFLSWVGSHWQNDGKPLASRCCTKPSMAWWPSLQMNSNTSRCTRHCGPDTLIIMQSCVDAYKFSFSQELFQTRTPFPVQPDQHHLWTPSRRPYTVYLASPIVITEPCHSSSKGCAPMAGYSLKNWRLKSAEYS